MTAFEIRPLRKNDDRTDFRSGNIDLDRFFRRYAGQNQFRHHVGTTYVALMDARIAGFATVSPGQIEAEGLPEPKRRGLPAYPLPVLRLARLATDERFQGRGVASSLLRTMLTLAVQMADDVGCVGLVVDAKPGAVEFYRRFGFFAVDAIAGQLGDRPQPQPMFLEIGAIPKP